MKLKKKKKTNQSKFQKNFFSFSYLALPYLISSFSILIIFFLSVDAYEYLVTEYRWIQNSINYTQTTIFLFILIISISFIDFKKIIESRRLFIYIVFVLFTLTIFFHNKYSIFYNNLQKYPKVKSVSKDWGMAGSWVKIEGRNFGSNFEKGKIYLGEDEMTIKKWNDKEIIFEIPVRGLAGSFELKVENEYNNQQVNKIYFEVK